VVRRVFGRERDEVTGEWRRLHNEELYALCKTKHCAGDKIEKNNMGKACSMYGGDTGYLWGEFRKRNSLENTGVDGRIILKWAFKKWHRGHGLDRSGLGR
jgi:hypothetical protein